MFAIAGVAILLRTSVSDTAPGNWIVADGEVEVAAPAFNPGGAVVIETNRP